MPPEVDQGFEQLLDYVRDNRGFDFTGYKRASLMRRVRKRMQDVGIASYPEYQDHLQVHPDEFTDLFNTILINVTSFFRDATSWDFLAKEILPQIVDANDRGHIRVWSVGTASGEEAYTVAMALAELVGLPNMVLRVKIYATDVDEEALAQARSGVYDAKAVQEIPEAQREKYLEPADGKFAFKKDLRRAVIFGRHDLVQDAPISKVDLIVCRNTLMYFNAEVQTKIYRGFHFALRPGGYLFLGKSEMLLTRTSMFVPLDLKRRVFVRVPTADDPLAFRAQAGDSEAATDESFQAAVFETSAVAQVVLDAAGKVVAANREAQARFGIAESDIGRPFHALTVSYEPIELRSRIDRAFTERQANLERAVPWRTRAGEQSYLDVEVIPLIAGGECLGMSISFTDVTRSQELRNELEESRRELETAYEEVQSTVEELETTNEELQSTNEELETTNEELQSTNEELETMNEELQSTNEELETINTELRERTTQLNSVNAFLESILGSVRAGLIVLDRNLGVETWNKLAEDLWGLRADEVSGKNIFALDFGLPVEELQQPIREVMNGSVDSAEVVVNAVNRRGKALRCKVLLSRMNDHAGDGNGVILLMESVSA